MNATSQRSRPGPRLALAKSSASTRRQRSKDNPFVGKTGAKPEIWSYGHRNLQGAQPSIRSPANCGRMSTAPKGDEINIPAAGKNYGWPVVGYGIDYSGQKMHDSTGKAGMEPPVHYWVPSIAPSGMAFYTADRFPA